MGLMPLLILAASNRAQAEKTDSSNKIQIAILLDTSGSMEGLVNQARIQIWNIVDELTLAERKGGKASIEIAVYQYGSSQVSKTTGFTKKIIDFTDDLDEVSRALFALSLAGGDEYCGEAIRQACDDLKWDPNAAYRAVFIAGNESFEQGQTTFGSTLGRLSSKNIVVNTIYCKWKKAKKGEADQWRIAAQLADGQSGRINHNHHVSSRATPYDSEFRNLNKRMNDSFVWYGSSAKKHRMNQIAQDKNASSISNAAFAKRMSAKVGHLYKHVHSDLVDAIQHGHVKMESMPESKMPENLREMSKQERMDYLNSKIEEREKVRREMATLIAKREKWLQANHSAGSQFTAETWGFAFVDAIKTQLASRGFQFAETKIASSK